MRLTIAYLTFRAHPRFEWFASSLARELRGMPDVPPSTVQVVVIDGRLWTGDHHRRLGLLQAAMGRIKFEHHEPKPCVWQGPARQTTKDYFAAASARNTALAYAKAGHVAFVDDLSVLVPGWLKAHIHAADNSYVLAGMTSKFHNVEVKPDGSYTLGPPFPPGQDSRLGQIPDDLELHYCHGGWLYGGTFSVPLETALAVNGQDEVYDSLGGEDYDFGVRLERTGVLMKITRACGTIEDEDAHHTESAVIRIDKPWAGDDGPFSSNFLYKKLMDEKDRYWTVGNDFNIREVRTSVLAGGEFPQAAKAPMQHWADGQFLSQM